MILRYDQGMATRHEPTDHNHPRGGTMDAETSNKVADEIADAVAVISGIKGALVESGFSDKAAEEITIILYRHAVSRNSGK